MTISASAAPKGRPADYSSENAIIAVLRAKRADAYEPVVDVLIANGVRSVELTLTTPGTFDALPQLIARHPDGVFGVGTVTSVDEAEQAIACGARYLVTPTLDLEVIAAACAAEVPIFPGALTPTEVFSAWRAGAAAVKIFPAQTVGPQYGRHLRGPFPELRFIPSGGVALDDIPSWLDAGASAVSLGGPLLGDALAGGSLDALAERSRRAASLAAAAEAAA